MRECPVVVTPRCQQRSVPPAQVFYNLLLSYLLPYLVIFHSVLDILFKYCLDK